VIQEPDRIFGMVLQPSLLVPTETL